MRTTLTIDDDILLAAKAMAQQQQKTIGEMVSELARRSLQPTGRSSVRNGIKLLPDRDGSDIVTLDIVNALRDETP